jgi:hypothetical protein
MPLGVSDERPARPYARHLIAMLFENLLNPTHLLVTAPMSKHGSLT